MGEWTQLQAADGHNLDAYVARPDTRPKAGLVICQEIFGVNSHIRSVADGYAAEGYLAVAPALFDRLRGGIELGYQGDDIAQGRELRGQITWDQAIADVAAAACAAAVAGKVGVVGYCWGGSIAWLAACRLEVQAAVGYYGGQIYEHRALTPRCPVLLHFGEKDAGIPLDQVAAVRQAHPEVPVHLYPADHGFNCDQRGSYHAESAATARKRSLEFLRQHLG